MDWRIPKNPVENAKWRLKLRRTAAGKPGLQAALRTACREDVLWFINWSCWLFEPRGTAKFIPFVTWPPQDKLILGMEECLQFSYAHPDNKMDFGIEKSRAEGVTWSVLMWVLWHWRFDPLFSAGLVSRNMDCADSSLNPDALMPKIDWQLELMPKWLLPVGFDPFKHRRMSEHSLLNPENGATITAFAATGDVAAGGRRTVFLMDEFGRFRPGEDWLALASTQHVASCRGLLGTYKGQSGAFYKTMQEETGMRKFRLHWSDNPVKNKLLYEVHNRGFRAIRPEEADDLRVYLAQNEDLLKRLKQRGFLKRSQVRSPWYDKECDRLGATPASIAEELDIDPGGVKAKLFDREMIDRLLVTTARPPLHEGELVYDHFTYEPKRFLPVHDGKLKLWCPIGPDEKPPSGSYVFGLDLAMGLGGEYSSNSTLVVFDATSGDQVAEIVTNTTDGYEMAEYTAALAKWFWGATVNYERNGMAGAQYHRRLYQDGLWGNLYYDPSKRGKHRSPGTHYTSTIEKYNVLLALSSAMQSDEVIIRSEMLLKECLQFELKGDKAIHIGERDTQNEALKGEAHGDVVIGAAMAYQALKQVQERWGPDKYMPNQPGQPAPPPEFIPRECYAGRRMERLERESRSNRWNILCCQR